MFEVLRYFLAGNDKIQRLMRASDFLFLRPHCVPRIYFSFRMAFSAWLVLKSTLSLNTLHKAPKVAQFTRGADSEVFTSLPGEESKVETMLQVL